MVQTEDWQFQPLGELVENLDALRVPVKEADRKPGPFPYYGASGVVDHVDRYIFDGKYLLVAEDGENLRTRKTPIAFLASGKFWVNNHAHIIRGNDRADTRFLAYALSMTNVGAYLTGSTMPKLTQANMNRIPIYCPRLAEQRAIARILGTLDDKIELNRRMNASLEAMASSMYKSWFIDFDPVRAKAEGEWPIGMQAKTVALFPERFEESALGDVPRGWQVAPMPERFDINPPRSIAKDAPGPYLEMGNMPTTSARVLGWEYRDVGSGMRFINGDVLVARITPCLENGKTAFVDFLPEGQTGWGSTEYIVIRSKAPLTPEYAYFLARSDDFRTHAIKNMTGTSGRQRVPASAFNGYLVVVPPPEIAQAFGNFASGVLAAMKAHDEESQTLAAIRNALLPKLLSGEVRVKSAEKLVEGVLV